MKNKVLKNSLAIALAATMVVGCGSTAPAETGAEPKTETQTQTATSTESTDSATAAEASKYQTTYGSKQFDNVTITVELFDRSNAPDGSTITDNKWTKYVNEQMNKVGINVEFVPVPRWDEVTKMQAMVASQTAPDLTLTYTYAYAEDYYNQGGTWNLSEFIDGADQALNMKKYLGSDVIDIGRNESGELYGIVAKRATTAKSNFFIRKDWLDKLGLEIPTNPDELYTALDKMVHENPDGMTGVSGAIIWNGWNLKQVFSKIAGDPLKVNVCGGGEDVIQDYYDPGMYDYYQFLNKLYNGGILHQEYYNLAEDDFKSEIVTGNLGFCEYSVNGNVDVLRGSLLKTLKENVSDADFVSIPQFKNINDGQVYSAAYGAGGLIAFCPKTASEEVVEACMTYLDWMCTEDGGFVLYHGFEGEHYDMVDGVPVVKDAEYNAQDKDWIRTDLFIVGNQGYFETVDDFNKCTSKEAPGYEDYVIQNYEYALAGTLNHDASYTSPSTADLITDLNIAKDDYQVKMITCAPEEFDQMYNEYMDELKSVGIDTIISEREEHYNN
ncbi:putative aldouronate transport system substrate-binding protein [Butyrivibrio sp. Su6]|uniref:extracellular solute-binding protein n=1 Tax=Butyrivibrio sp. Su6 TaxID=1520810 RepID=UPI00089EB91E|nr:extracellular solute-binding protein [Butyrivibrio sp. Su6]SEG01755.1 putative aldouronate transport system substrate-binding protein [Butyrivibrio sp. Su6]